PEYVRGSYETSTSSLIGNTASDLFSNQLSNWLSQIYKDLDIGFNYHPGNQITGDEIELALSTQIFNDRVSINGNIGNNPNPRTMNNSELVGDFEINVKLTRNGKLQLKAYNKSNNNLIYETAPYTQGLGVSYKENYNHIEELWRNFLALFGKK
ncbi:MAG: translocation/assembly module TamB domain-containing protein, partial [Prolixibacteraceae bacterium]